MYGAMSQERGRERRVRACVRKREKERERERESNLRKKCLTTSEDDVRA